MFTIFANRTCPYVQRVLLTLACRQIPEWQVNLKWMEFQSPPEELVNLNPDWTVPTLVAGGGEWFDDSITIMRFLDDIPSLGKSLFGHSPLEKSRIEQQARTLAREFLRPTRRILGSFGDRFGHPQRELAFRQGCEALERALRKSDGPFLGGEVWNACDITLAPFVHQIMAAREIDPRFPIPTMRGPLMNYMMALDRHPIVQDVCPPLRETMALISNWLLPPPEVEAIRTASSAHIDGAEGEVRALNDELRAKAMLASSHPLHWELKHDGLGVSMHATLRPENSSEALQILHTAAALQESAGHLCALRLDGFQTLHVTLSTHHPMHGISERDLAFARAFATFLENRVMYGEEMMSAFD